MGRTSYKVTLLRYTPAPEEITAMGAKLCYSSSDIEEIKQGIESKDQAKYLQRLVDMGHLSPIEHASFTFGIEGISRSLMAQFTRHRVASFSVQSQRYVSKMGEEFNYILPPSIEALGEDAVAAYAAQMEQMHQWYTDWVERLGGKSESSLEDARFVLPNACETKMLVTMNARELIHFFTLRCCNRAQWEIREVAWDMLRLCLDVAPSLFKNAGPSCIGGPCSEGKMTCGKADQVRARQAELL